jgi:hypothetical protein
MFVLVEAQPFSKSDTPGSEFWLMKTNLAGGEIHRPLNDRFWIFHILFQSIQQVFAVVGWNLPCPTQASLVIPEQIVVPEKVARS